MSGIAKHANSAFRRQAPRGAKSWGRSLPSISVSHLQLDSRTSIASESPYHDDPSDQEMPILRIIFMDKKGQSTPATIGTSLAKLSGNHRARCGRQNCQGCMVFATLALEWCGGPHCS
ncbi:MAG: hypothetical protein SGBAC_000825 [Bacillariaceae sp.]